VHYGTKATDYATDVLARYATGFIQSVPAGDPLFLYFAPHAPHGPATPPPRYKDAFALLPDYRPPNYNEPNVSAEPSWVRALPLLSRRAQRVEDLFRIDQYRTLLAVDDAVAGILRSLAATGRLSDTLLVFTSDNGLELGSHRWENKMVPWEEAIRVPLIVRFDPLQDGVPSTNRSLVLNLDLAPTMAAAAGVGSPGSEGTSFLPLLGTDPLSWRRDFLIEHWGQGSPIPPYCAVRDERYKYVKYQDGEEELYELANDPFELHNLASDPRYRSAKERLHARLVELCSPPPPYFKP
jgi:N-acetylglucosamine-6-sulfatase